LCSVALGSYAAAAMSNERTVPRWTLERGGEASLIETDGDRVSLESTRAFPPGAPLVARAEGTAEPYRVKVRGSRRISDTHFRVDGRFVNLSRSERERLLALLKPEA
jgi:hypothetical protein